MHWVTPTVGTRADAGRGHGPLPRLDSRLSKWPRPAPVPGPVGGNDIIKRLPAPVPFPYCKTSTNSRFSPACSVAAEKTNCGFLLESRQGVTAFDYKKGILVKKKNPNN